MATMSEGESGVIIPRKDLHEHLGLVTMTHEQQLDSIYNFIDMLDLEELNNIIKYCEEQKSVIGLIDKRRKKLAEILRIERIRFRKEMNNVKKQLLIKRQEETESSESEETTEKKKPIIKKSKEFVKNKK